MVMNLVGKFNDKIGETYFELVNILSADNFRLNRSEE